MRKLVGFGMLMGCLWAAEPAQACKPGGGDAVEVIIVPPDPSPLATQQSQTFLADATRLDAKAEIEESSASTQVLTARTLRRKAASIRVQAAQVSEPSQSALLAKADKFDAQAASADAAAATFSARARIIRTRAKALRTLSARVLVSGPVSGQILARIELPALPAGVTGSGLTALDAAPKAAPMHKKAPAVTTVALRI